MTAVLDSSAVLAIIKGEVGADRARDAFPDVAMSTVNYHEVVAKLVDRGLSDPEVEALIGQFEMNLHPHDAAQALAAGLLRRATRAAGLSLGDRACLALALALGAPVLTADRAWAGLDVGVEIEVIRT